MSRIQVFRGSWLVMALCLVIGYGCTKENIEKAENEKNQPEPKQIMAPQNQPQADKGKGMKGKGQGQGGREKDARTMRPERQPDASGDQDSRRESRRGGRGRLGDKFIDTLPAGLASCPAHPSSLGAVEMEMEKFAGKFRCPSELPIDNVCGYFIVDNDPDQGKIYYESFRNECMVCARTYNQDGNISQRGQTYRFMGFLKGDCPAGE